MTTLEERKRCGEIAISPQLDADINTKCLAASFIVKNILFLFLLSKGIVIMPRYDRARGFIGPVRPRGRPQRAAARRTTAPTAKATYTTLDGENVYKNYRKQRPVAKGARPAQIIKSQNWRWKASRTEDTVAFSMTGNVSATRFLILNQVDSIPLYDPSAAAAANEKDNTSTRLTNNIYMVSQSLEIAARFTHNHALAMRVIVFRNSGWQEGLSWAGAIPFPTQINNLFINFVTRENEVTPSPAVDLMGKKLNYNLMKSAKDKFFDRTFMINPLQGLPTGGEEAGSLSIRKYSLKVPINRWVSYEARRSSSSQWPDKRTGTIFYAILLAPADPANASNAGGAIVDVRSSVSFKENA